MGPRRRVAVAGVLLGLAALATLPAARADNPYCQWQPSQPCNKSAITAPDCLDGCTTLGVPANNNTVLVCGPNNRCYHNPRAANEPCAPADPGPQCGAGVNCHPVINTCLSSPRQVNDQCIPGTKDMDCGAGLKCHDILRKCQNDPPTLNQVCSDTAPCAGPDLTCDLTIKRCVPLSAPGQHCHALGRKCWANLTCDGRLRACYSKPRVRGEPCGDTADSACGPGLFCMPHTQECADIPKPGGACSSVLPCPDGYECAQYVNRCLGKPRQINDPCINTSQCDSGLFCDPIPWTCQRPADVGEQCWDGRPCAGVLTCSPRTHRCVDNPAGNNDPCGTPGESQCGNGYLCHPTLKRCVRYSNEREPCFMLSNGDELKCTSPFYCFPGIQICFHYPADGTDSCSHPSWGANKLNWPCRLNLNCSAAYPYCVNR